MARDIPKKYSATVTWRSKAKARLVYDLGLRTYTAWISPLGEHWSTIHPSFLEGDANAWAALDEILDPAVRRQLQELLQSEVGKAVLAMWGDMHRESLAAGSPTLRMR